MHYILGRHKTDVEAWKRVIQSDKEKHDAGGLHFQEVWANVDNPQEIFFIFKIDDLDKAKIFLQKTGALDREKQKRGDIPELVFLNSKSL